MHKLWRLRTLIWIKSYDGGRSECRNLKIPAFEFQTLILKLFLFFCVLTVMLFLLDFLSSQLLILLWNRKRQVGYFIELAWLSALLVWAETPSTELLTVILRWRKLKRVTACLICQFCRQQHTEHLYHESWANFHWLYFTQYTLYACIWKQNRNLMPVIFQRKTSGFMWHVCAHLSINWINHANCTNVRSTWLHEELSMLRLVPLKLPFRIYIAFMTY